MVRFRVQRICALTVLATMSVATDGGPQARPATQPANAEHSPLPKSPLKGVPDFGKVTPKLYRGGQPSKKGFENLARIGIDIVVDLRGSRDGERKQVTKLGMQYVPIPWHCYNKRDTVFAQFLTLLRENPDKKVFVHCRLGDDRTGMMIAAYRMAEQGWTAEEARKEMVAYGFTWWHHLICPGLGAYESSFPQRFQTSPAFQRLRSSENSQ
jgi:tyrosine-protein phosphatase SIW14